MSISNKLNGMTPLETENGFTFEFPKPLEETMSFVSQRLTPSGESAAGSAEVSTAARLCEDFDYSIPLRRTFFGRIQSIASNIDTMDTSGRGMVFTALLM